MYFSGFYQLYRYSQKGVVVRSAATPFWLATVIIALESVSGYKVPLARLSIRSNIHASCGSDRLRHGQPALSL